MNAIGKPNKSRVWRNYLVLTANALDHCETLLYSLLTPWIARSFFLYQDPVVQLMAGYSVLLTGFLAKPLGALLFSWLAHVKHPLFALRWSLMGSSLAVGAFIMCPGRATWGVFAPITLIVLRLLRGVFYSGQTALSKIYVVDVENHAASYKMSYLYQFSTVAGYVSASLWASAYALYTDVSWRWMFVPFLMVGCIGMVFKTGPMHVVQSTRNKFSSLAQLLVQLWPHKSQISMVAFTTGVGYLTWYLVFVMFNALIPLATKITAGEMLSFNSGLMWIDMVLVLVLGKTLVRFAPKSVLSVGSLVLGCSLPFAFALFDYCPTMFWVTAVRFWIVFWGVWLSCPLHLYYRQSCPKESVYFIVSAGTILGGTIVGKATPVLSIWVYHVTGSFFAIGCLGALLSLMTWASLRSAR